MSNSYRTQLTRIIAARRIPRDREGEPIFPRVIERKPREGDIHPLTKQHIRAFLGRMRLNYRYGLKEVELCPRTSPNVGRPWGEYLPGERKIRLFSVPPTEWRLKYVEARRLYEWHGASVTEEQGGLVVHWQEPVDLAYFLYREVFLHELGHHYDHQYRYKRKWPEGMPAEESSANRHAFNLAKRAAFYRWHEIQATSRVAVTQDDSAS